MSGVLSEHSHTDIHKEMGEPLKQSEKQTDADQKGCVQVVHSMDDADGDYKGPKDDAKLLSTSIGSMGGVLSEHSDTEIHKEMGEPPKQIEKPRSGPIKERYQYSDSESETEYDIDEDTDADQDEGEQVVPSTDDADIDYQLQGAQDVEVFVRAKLLSTEVHGKNRLKIISVFQVARLFQTEEVTRTFFMQHVDVTLDTKSINQCQFGLYKRGPLTPIPVHKVKQYGMVMMTGEYNNILVSNDVDSNKLYLKIKVKAKRVVVAANYNKKSYFNLMQGQGAFANQYTLISNHFADRALKYDATTKEVVLSPYDSSDPSFYFSFPPVPVPQKDQQNKYVFIHEAIV